MFFKIRNQMPAVLSVLATAALLIFTILWFSSSINTHTENIRKNYVSDNTRSLSVALSKKIDDLFVILESQTGYFSDVDFSDPEALREAVLSANGTGTFSVIGVADRSGNTANNLGGTEGNILETRFFEEVMRGHDTISDTVITDSEGNEVFAAGIPVTGKGRIVGMIYGTFGKNLLSSLMTLPSPTRASNCMLLDTNGDILASSDFSDLRSRGIRHFLNDTGITLPARNSDSSTTVMLGNEENIISVVSLATPDWYYAVVYPLSNLSAESYHVTSDTLMFVVMIVVSFVIMLLSVMFLLKNNSDIMTANERFKLVTVESQDIIFDYNYQKELLTLDGNIDNITAKNRNVFSKAEMMGFLETIHEEDKDIKSRILGLGENDDTLIKGEFRIKCLDGSYCWFRMKGSVVRSHDGTLQRFIGSMINVDEQMNRDARITKTSDTDPLTGIFTKSAFYDHVNEELRNASDSDLFALYIIDIDNFRLVNEHLGHSIGDQVLADVAQKLCIVFSDRDCVGRIGGDKFAAFLYLSSKARTVGMNLIEVKAKAICSQMNDTYSAKNKQISISASVGVAIYPYSGRDYGTLFRNARKALDKIKVSGKNTYGIFNPSEHENS